MAEYQQYALHTSGLPQTVHQQFKIVRPVMDLNNDNQVILLSGRLELFRISYDLVKVELEDDATVH